MQIVFAISIHIAKDCLRVTMANLLSFEAFINKLIEQNYTELRSLPILYSTSTLWVYSNEEGAKLEENSSLLTLTVDIDTWFKVTDYPLTTCILVVKIGSVKGQKLDFKDI